MTKEGMIDIFEKIREAAKTNSCYRCPCKSFLCWRGSNPCDWEILKKNLKGGDKQVPCSFLVKSDGLYYQDDNGKMVNSHDVLGKIITGEYTYKLV